MADVQKRLDDAKRVTAQVIHIELADGRKAAFVGPELVSAEEMAEGSGGIAIAKLAFARPYQLSDGYFFAHMQDGNVVLMRETPAADQEVN